MAAAETTTVYVLIQHGCAACDEPDSVAGVFSTRELAERAAAHFPATHYAEILSRPLDPSPLPRWDGHAPPAAR
jgi:hypothetical protein